MPRVILYDLTDTSRCLKVGERRYVVALLTKGWLQALADFMSEAHGVGALEEAFDEPRPSN